jgi:CxxC motif-containing protein (DUF1111 family)
MLLRYCAALVLVASFMGASELAPEAQSGGQLSLAVDGAGAFAQPAPLLDTAQRQRFDEARGAFVQKWVVPFLPGGPWGLGPVANADACVACHAGNGRGLPPASEDEPIKSMLVRLSIPGDGKNGAPRPEPNYGEQLNNLGVNDRVSEEGQVRLRWSERSVEFLDGDQVVLRRPQIQFVDLNYGPLARNTLTSLRIAPATLGMGLLDAVADSAITERAARQSELGLNGRPNWVWDGLRHKAVLGRFGWKANQPNLAQQVAAAFHGDIGVTSAYFPEEQCTKVQDSCAGMPPGARPELLKHPFDGVMYYLRAGAVPARRNVSSPEVQRGEALFAAAGCAGCHAPELRTGDYPAFPALANQVIRPYSDLLLHDMGEDLADARPDFKASGRDWRTPPLWGLGLHAAVSGRVALLHDGRAASISEAILWHGGEAERARENFRAMPRADRAALLQFLQSL